MSSIKSYKEIKLENGEWINRIKGLNQSDWVKACEKIGLYIPDGYGKGSHVAVYKDNKCMPQDVSCCVVTIPRNIYPNFQRDLFKKVLFYGIVNNKFSEKELWEALGLKI